MTAPRILPTLALLAMAWGASGCLITDPIIPIEPQVNKAPVFLSGRPQPNPDSPLPPFAIGSSQQISFDASCIDPDGETTVQQIQFLWTLDGTSVQSGADAPFYKTTPAAIGAGTHKLHVRITDLGVPQGLLETEWTIVVQ